MTNNDPSTDTVKKDALEALHATNMVKDILIESAAPQHLFDRINQVLLALELLLVSPSNKLMQRRVSVLQEKLNQEMSAHAEQVMMRR